MQIKNLAEEHHARCLVVDPISALAKSGNKGTVHSVAERLIDWAKSAGITVVCTSLPDKAEPQLEGTPLQISTIADTWIHLNYLVHAGERNRGLSIVKSRGTAHSNQVRELVLSSTGVTLADAYTAGGEVIMGTLRWEKERAVRAAREETEAAAKQKRDALETEDVDLEVRIKAMQRQLKARRTEKRVRGRLAADHTVDMARGRTHLSELRGVDTV